MGVRGEVQVGAMFGDLRERFGHYNIKSDEERL